MIKKEQSLAPLKAQVSKIAQFTEAVVIRNSEEMAQAVDMLGQIKTIGKKITEQKEKITRPLSEALKNARALFKPIEDQWNEATKTLKWKMVRYQTLQETKAEAKIEKIEKKIEAGSLTFVEGVEKIAGLEPEVRVETSDFSLTFRKDRKMVITDLSLIPDEYWLVDEIKLRKDILAGIQVPGAEIVIIKTPVSAKVK